MKTDRKYNELTQEKYKECFRGGTEIHIDKAKLALEHALDIRKFEIDLYWKRAAYFWTLIGADLVGYGTLQVRETQNKQANNLSILLSCLGLIFSFAWFCVNKGSKQWQENWENHVDMLEDDVVGPLYKIVLHRPEPSSRSEKLIAFFTGPGPFSVSKINQIISMFVTIFWIVLLVTSLFNSLGPFRIKAPIAWAELSYVLCTLVCCTTFLALGRTEYKNHTPVAKLRVTKISTTVKEDADIRNKEASL